MNIKLDSIILFARKVDTLKTFYAGLLGLEVVEEQVSEWVLLKAGQLHIGLHKIGDSYLANDKSERNSMTPTKMVFLIDEDINQVRDWLISNGIRMREIKSFDNFKSRICDGEDPVGNVFQLKQPGK